MVIVTAMPSLDTSLIWQSASAALLLHGQAQLLRRSKELPARQGLHGRCFRFMPWTGGHAQASQARMLSDSSRSTPALSKSSK